jgi:glutamine phosphoribosylpyrophosphate amidotransferase
MCGIVGYVGRREVVPLLIDGLRRLEYRGYDSAGVAVVGDGRIATVRAAGKLDRLVEKLDGGVPPGAFGLGHTRWATHGAPIERNAHPLVDSKERIALIHVGSIPAARSVISAAAMNSTASKMSRRILGGSRRSRRTISHSTTVSTVSRAKANSIRSIAKAPR